MKNPFFLINYWLWKKQHSWYCDKIAWKTWQKKKEAVNFLLSTQTCSKHKISFRPLDVIPRARISELVCENCRDELVEEIKKGLISQMSLKEFLKLKEKHE